jgi:hypothetical protein
VKVAFFTSSMGGAGHIARALTVRNGLLRQGFRGELRYFGPPIPYASAQHLEGYTVAALSDAELRSPRLAQASALAEALRGYDPDVIVVDMFWLPLRHILPTLRAEAWLLVHSVPPNWLSGPLLAPFERGQYKRILGMEPLRYYPREERLEPFVICNPDECHPPEALKRRLGLAPEEHLTLIVQTGFAGEVEALVERHTRPGTTVVALSMRRDEAIFPVAPWLLGVDRLVGGGGYHFFWETVWLGLQPRTSYQPFARSIDHQEWRVQHQQHYKMTDNGADQLARLLLRGG